MRMSCGFASVPEEAPMNESLTFDSFMVCPVPFSIHRYKTDEDTGRLILETVSYNDSFEKAFFTDTAPELKFRNGPEIFDRLFGNPNTAGLLKAEMERVYLSGSREETEHDFSVSDQSYRARIFRVDDTFLGVVYENITRERMLELDIQAFLKVNLDLLCVISPDARFVKVNGELVRTLGYNGSDLESQSVFSFLHPGDVGTTHLMINQLNAGMDVPFFTNRFRGKDGVYRSLRWSAENDRGMLFASARDISDSTLLSDKLQDSASRDSMTGLFSRQAFDVHAADIIRKFKRRYFPVSMMIMDIDFFNKINDHWGHPVGDQVLKHVATILKENLRQTDFPARLGGEEFVVIMLDTPEKGALFAAEKIRRKLELTPHKVAGEVTASFGVAALERDEPFEEWFIRTDTSLYLAKNMGRNRTCGSSESRACDVLSCKYVWKKEWASGNVRIDEQHRSLLDTGNRLIEYYETKQRIKEQEAINELMIDMDQHFRSEEFILKQSRYEKLKEHSALHDDLRKQMRFWRDLRNQQRVHPTAFYCFLMEKVIIHHMVVDDAKFFDLFK